MEKLTRNTVKETGAIKTIDFNYELPDEKIAKYPLAERDKSKLLVYENGIISQKSFKDIPLILPNDTLLVFNNTKVVKARLVFTKETGSRIEIFCLEPVIPADYQLSFSQTQTVVWRCLVGNAKKWKNGKLALRLENLNNKFILKAETIKKEKDDYLIKFEWDCNLSFGEIIELAGITPIPPYLNRDSEETDKARYQTIYAKIDGSVAAPTAGLHFTDHVLKELRKRGHQTEELTLHVGAGTFQPVKSLTIDGHTMHSESVSVSLPFLKKLVSHTGNVIAVGTTSVRSLESLYWLGMQIAENNFLKSAPHIGQWEAYMAEPKPEFKEMIGKIIWYLEQNSLTSLHFSTQLIIAPGYKFRVIKGMLTNFHQPQSTLLLLIAAFLGDDWKKVYEYALKNEFRFLSYGDSNLYLK